MRLFSASFIHLSAVFREVWCGVSAGVSAGAPSCVSGVEKSVRTELPRHQAFGRQRQAPPQACFAGH